MAEVSTCDKRHATILVRSGRVIAVGVNTFRNDPCNVDLPKQQAAYHSEINALKQVKNAAGAVAYNARIGKVGDVRLSRPCRWCTEALREAGIKRVVWTPGSEAEL